MAAPRGIPFSPATVRMARFAATSSPAVSRSVRTAITGRSAGGPAGSGFDGASKPRGGERLALSPDAPNTPPGCESVDSTHVRPVWRLGYPWRTIVAWDARQTARSRSTGGGGERNARDACCAAGRIAPGRRCGVSPTTTSGASAMPDARRSRSPGSGSSEAVVGYNFGSRNAEILANLAMAANWQKTLENKRFPALSGKSCTRAANLWYVPCRIA